jgi:hypothetical protein
MPDPLPYHNNLKVNDHVLDVESKRPGIVVKTPRGDATTAFVKLQGDAVGKRVYVGRLRLVFDGKPEDVAPIDGEIPTAKEVAAAVERSDEEPVDALKRQREKNKLKMEAMNREFAGLRMLNDRLDKAIAALEAV